MQNIPGVFQHRPGLMIRRLPCGPGVPGSFDRRAVVVPVERFTLPAPLPSSVRMPELGGLGVCALDIMPPPGTFEGPAECGLDRGRLVILRGGQPDPDPSHAVVIRLPLIASSGPAAVVRLTTACSLRSLQAPRRHRYLVLSA